MANEKLAAEMTALFEYHEALKAPSAKFDDDKFAELVVALMAESLARGIDAAFRAASRKIKQQRVAS